MVCVLFDFEIDPNVNHPFPKAFYDRIKAFYRDCYASQSQLTNMLVTPNQCPPVMLIVFVDEGIKSIPVNMPDFIAAALHHTVKQNKFDALKVELDVLLKETS